MTKLTGKKILLLITLIFVIWNLSWFLITTIKYNNFVKDIPKNEWGLHFIKKEDGYIYSVKKPNYLRFTGNLVVANNEKGETLIIWPLIFGGYEYGFRLQKDGAAYEIYVDENMEPINKDDTVAAQKVEEYKVELEELFSKANEMWELEE
ncbi:hypothetical protein AT864_00722 [Anoxybacillus sp. P3H1B]|uniref:Uncharacterized protein n=1 Tax=Anoxybacteroides rupiense TaxID=311460 RepID=A0ABD5IXX4_9BACL|nr:MULTISPECIES: hypothetical protein [Anoxybacillus]KXG10854.1 hypothetical protein AT864_00722 [Anoxybacillus sp. P3H1B]MED5053217.1 hypothetical protein [Anoxybacillus rupiensis]